MKIETYADINVLELDKAIYHYNGFPDPNGRKPNSKEKLPKPKKSPEVRVDMKVYTDGEIIQTIEGEPEPIKEYYIGKIKYNREVDTLVKKKVYIKNASYILVVTVAKYGTWIGENGLGWFDFIQNAEIFLNNPKDKVALRKARETILEISGSPRYNSIFDALFNRSKTISDLNYKKIDNNVYQLKNVIKQKKYIK